MPVSKRSSSFPLTESELKHQSQELGIIGRLCGSKENAPVYFAGIIAVLALLGAIVVGLESPTNSDLLKSLAAIVIAALSFLGGAYGRSSG